MCQLLLKIESILESIVVGCVAICNIDCDVIIVTVGQVNVVAVVSSCSVGTRHFIVVNFNTVVKSTLAPVCVTNTYPTTSSKRISIKPTPAHISTIFQTRSFHALRRVVKLG